MAFLDDLKGLGSAAAGAATFGLVGDDLNTLGEKMGLGGRANNEFRDVNQDNFGLPGGDERRQRLRAMEGEFANRAAPSANAAQVGQAAQIRQNPQAQFRSGQQALVGALQQQAAGRGPSLAGAQFERAADRGVAQQQALAASAGPQNAAGAARQASQQSSALTSALAGQAADARIAEQMSARQQLGGVLQGARGQDIGLAQGQAALDQQGILEQARLNQQAGLANLDAQLRQTGMNDQARLEALRQALANSQAQQAGGIAFEQQRGQRFNTLAGIPTAGEQVIQGAASLAGAVL